MSEIHYLVCGHTAKGYINLFSSNLAPLNKIYNLIGDLGAGKLNFMKRIASKLEDLDINVEYLHNPSAPEALNGVIFPQLGVGIVDGASTQMIEARAPGAIEEYINLGEAWDTAKLVNHTEQIIQLKANMQRSYEQAYTAFADGLKAYKELKKIYIENMNFEKADELTAYLIPSLLGDTKLDKAGYVRHRFFGSSTPYGSMDFVDNIIDNIAARYFIKGRPGSGKSTILKKILKAATTLGLDVEVYHCGFDPDNLDMLLFPELSLCIFDSTFPHEYFPCREEDVVIDTYGELIKEGTDELHAEELVDIAARYKSHTKEGIAHLAAAKSYLDELEQLYYDATDFSVIDQKWNELYLKIVKVINPEGIINEIQGK